MQSLIDNEVSLIRLIEIITLSVIEWPEIVALRGSWRSWYAGHWGEEQPPALTRGDQQ